jgi:hypothetical protein
VGIDAAKAKGIHPGPTGHVALAVDPGASGCIQVKGSLLQFQVGINLNDATQLNGASAPETSVRRTDGAGRYLLTASAISGPAMFDTARLDREANNYEALAAGQQAASVLHTATLDEVLCVAAH